MKPSTCALVALGMLLLAGCSRGDPDQAPQLDEYFYGRRRKNVPFAPQRDAMPETALGDARRMDAVEALIDSGRYAQASAELDRWTDAGGDHPRAHYLRGRAAYGRHEWQAAIDALTRAVEASPRYIEPRLLMGQSFLKLERLAAAEGVYQELDRLLPKGPWGPLGMGQVARRRGDDTRATTLIDEALSRDPTHAPSLGARADLARVAGETVMEEVLLLRFLAQEPDAAGAERRLGEIAAADKRPDDARRRFERAWDLDRDPAVAKRLAELAQMRGDLGEADRWQRHAGTARAKERDDEGMAPR